MRLAYFKNMFRSYEHSQPELVDQSLSPYPL